MQEIKTDVPLTKSSSCCDKRIDHAPVIDALWHMFNLRWFTSEHTFRIIIIMAVSTEYRVLMRSTSLLRRDQKISYICSRLEESWIPLSDRFLPQLGCVPLNSYQEWEFRTFQPFQQHIGDGEVWSSLERRRLKTYLTSSDGIPIKNRLKVTFDNTFQCRFIITYGNFLSSLCIIY